jgi:hypothetical protein
MLSFEIGRKDAEFNCSGGGGGAHTYTLTESMTQNAAHIHPSIHPHRRVCFSLYLSHLGKQWLQ